MIIQTFYHQFYQENDAVETQFTTVRFSFVKAGGFEKDFTKFHVKHYPLDRAEADDFVYVVLAAIVTTKWCINSKIIENSHNIVMKIIK